MPRKCLPLWAGTLHVYWSTLSADWADRYGQGPWVAVSELDMSMDRRSGGNRDFVHTGVGR